MVAHSEKFVSIRLTRFLMILVGFWTAENEKEKTLINFLLRYTIFMMMFAFYVTGVDIYHSSGDFYRATYNACALMPVIACLAKILAFAIHRPQVMNIIRYTRKNFWNGVYDDFGNGILRDTDRKGILLICSFAFWVQTTIMCYIITPVIENIGKNDSDRILTFNMWINFPTSETPWYEVISTVQDLSSIHVGLCFCCFDSFLCILNIHVAAQFKILQHRFSTICDSDDAKNPKKYPGDGELDLEKYSENCLNKFKDCVTTHHDLIRYVEDLEDMFTYLVLGQLLMSSFILCVAGFQVSQGQGTIVRRLIFVAHTFGSSFQLLVVTLAADEVMVESQGVATAAYTTLFCNLPYDRSGRSLRSGLIMVMMRAQRACCITAGKFFPVSLETFTKVTTTSMSYFTMLRQMEDDIVQN